MTRTLLAVTLLLAAAGSASAAPPAVESAAPGVGRRGTTFTVTLVGARLLNPLELLVYTPGVTCTKLVAASENSVTATLTAAADCPLGGHAFRLRTAGGVSELRTVTITPFPIVAEAEPNDSPAAAQLLAPGVTVAGVIEAADSDYFAVDLKVGDRLSAEVVAIRLGAEMLDAVLTVAGPDGKILREVDDTALFRQDPFASVVATTAGRHVIRVRDTAFGGGENHRLALHVGHFPRPAGVFPLGGPAGRETRIRHLDGTGAEERVPLPAAGPTVAFFPADGPHAAPTPHTLRVSPFPNVLEAEPNDTPAAAGPAAGWPVAFNGIIQTRGDVDHYRFAATAGDAIVVEVFASRLGSPVDSVVDVFDAAGRPVGTGDDDETHDSKLRLKIPATGEYTLRVADKRGDGGPLYAYRVELSAPVPGLAVFLPGATRKSQDKQTVTVPRGNRVTAFLAVRRDGCDGPAAITPGALPDGVTLGPVAVPAGQYLVPVVFEASGAAAGGKLVEFAGRVGGTRGRFTQAIDLLHGPGDSSYHTVTVSQLAVVVADPGPISVNLDPPAAPLAADGSLDVTVRISRGAGFDGAVEVTFPYLPPGVEAGDGPTIIPAAATTAAVRLTAEALSELGTFPLVASAKPATAKQSRRDMTLALMGMGAAPPAGGRRGRAAPDGVIPVSSAMTALAVTAAPVAGGIPAVSAEQGKTVRVTCPLAKPAPAAFTATLAGLPPRAAAKPVAVPAGAAAVAFDVTIDPTTPAGDHDSLVCELAGTAAGHAVVYRVGRGGVLTVRPPGAAKTDAAGNPLSPLDALRRDAPKKK